MHEASFVYLCSTMLYIYKYKYTFTLAKLNEEVNKERAHFEMTDLLPFLLHLDRNDSECPHCRGTQLYCESGTKKLLVCLQASVPSTAHKAKFRC